MIRIGRVRRKFGLNDINKKDNIRILRALK